MTFANPLSPWAVPFVLAAIAAISWLAYRHTVVTGGRRAALTALRFVTLLLLVLFLMRPIRTTGEPQRDAIVPILVDNSRSMGIEDAGGRRRIDRAREILTEKLLPVLEPRFQTEVLAFGDGLAPVTAADLSATARHSDLSVALEAVRERYRERPVAGVVLLSDGGDTGVTGHGDFVGATFPVYAIGIGSASVAHDREVLGVTAAEAVFDDSRVDLAVSAVSHGYGTEPIPLRLLENGRPIEVRRVRPAADDVPIREVFQVSPTHGSATRYTIEIPEAPGELVAENNTRSTLVQPPSRVRRVLFVEGAPGFEHSFLKRAWAADPGLTVDSIVRKGKNEQGVDTYYIQAPRTRGDTLTTGYPQTAGALCSYDAIVLANVDAGQLTRAEQEATRAFVAERGGGLLVLGSKSLVNPGLAGSALEEALPLHLSDRGDTVVAASSSRGINRVALTPAGELHPVMQLGGALDETRKRWDAIPALASTAPVGGPRPGAAVLATAGSPSGPARALVAVERYGEGRSMVFTGEAAWRWRMLLPSSDKSYDTFWRQAIRWLALAASDPVAIAAPPDASPGDSVPLDIAVRDAAFIPQSGATVDVRVTSPDGRVEATRGSAKRRGDGEDDGRYLARFNADRPGVYRLNVEARRGTTTLGQAAASLLVGGADVEMSDPRLNIQVLQRLAFASGGRMIANGGESALLDTLRARVPAARLAVTRDLWHNVWSFAAIAGLLGAEWILRRRWGLR